MPERETTHQGSIEYLQYLTPGAELTDESDWSDELEDPLERIYRWMVRTRTFDQKALALQRQGELGTYAPVKGQEAAQIATVEALQHQDLLVPTYREMGAFLTRGIPAHEILQYWSGDERGHRSFYDRSIYPISIPVGSQPIHAVGAIRADQVQGKNNRVGVAWFGDGATSEGDMLEAMNFAGVWGTPVIFLCQNNQWAISVSREDQTASQTLAQKAEGFGFSGRQVDGNDPIGVFREVRRARELCLEQGQPYFLELLTYRRGDHTTADDAERYRDSEQNKAWEQKDPIRRTRQFLEQRNLWTDEDQDQLENSVKDWLDDQVAQFRSTSDPDPTEMVDHLYDEIPPSLRRQRREMENPDD